MVWNPSWPGALTDLLKTEVVVSVTLRGTTGRFTAPERWDTGEHTIDEDLVYGVVRGRVLGHIDERAIEAPAGSLIWCAAGTRFRFHAGGSDTVQLLRIALTFQAPSSARQSAAPLRGSIVINNCYETHPLVDRLIDEATRSDEYTTLRARGLLLEMVALVQRAHSAPPAARRLTAVQRRAIENHVDHHLAGWPTLADLADVAGLSPDYFSRVFRGEYGMSVQAWLVQQRINMAKLLLSETNQTVSEVAQQLGYSDLFYFSKQFKKVSGQSPRHYRLS
jgi:AraC-like DNA-binding protein/quercetin dioxygenase-like cupin family protein